MPRRRHRQRRLPSLPVRLRPGGRLLAPHATDVGRRIDLAVPEQSLLLLKATGTVPHTGGRRFKPDSEYYNTLLRWIQAGAPDDAASVPQVTGISLVAR